MSDQEIEQMGVELLRLFAILVKGSPSSACDRRVQDTKCCENLLKRRLVAHDSDGSLHLGSQTSIILSYSESLFQNLTAKAL